MAMSAITSMAALTSCEEEVQKTPESSLILENNIPENIPADGGTFSIPYIVENPVEGTEVTVSCAEDWVSCSVSKESIDITVEANTEKTARNTSVKVSYGENLSEEIEICQTGKSDITFDYDIPEPIPAEESSYVIKYQIENPVEGAEVSFSSEDEWLTANNDAESQSISITVAANTSIFEREGLFTLTYDKSFLEIKVKQAGETPTDAFSIVADEITATSITYIVTPAYPEMTYYTNIWDKEDYESYAETDHEYMEKTIDFLLRLCQNNGISLKDYLWSGKTEDVCDKLIPDYEYYYPVFGLSEEGESLSEVYKISAKTKGEEPVDIDLDITTEIKYNVVKIRVTPSIEDQYYVSGYYSKESVSDPEALKRKVQRSISGKLTSECENDMNKYLKKYGRRGKTSYSYQLEPNKEYIGYAAAISPVNGAVVSDVFSVDFTTGEPPTSDNVITLKTTKLTHDYVEVEINTTNEDEYLYYYFNKDGITNWDDDDEIFKQMTLIKLYKARGDTTIDYNMLRPEHEYVVTACGYQDGVRTTKVTKLFFKTEKKPQAPVSDVVASFTCGDYYDGNEIADKYGEDWDDARGNAVMPVDVQTEGEISDFYIQMYIGDYMDENFLDQEKAVANLKYSGIKNDRHINFFPTYEDPHTILAVAIDKNGMAGKVMRKLVTFSKDETKPVDGFNPDLAKRYNTPKQIKK